MLKYFCHWSSGQINYYTGMNKNAMVKQSSLFQLSDEEISFTYANKSIFITDTLGELIIKLSWKNCHDKTLYLISA